jgi:hypothetical protein
MRIQLADWLAQGSPAPLRWGDPLAAVVAHWPEAKAEVDEQLRRGYPFAYLDEVEFYFEGDKGNEFAQLSEIVIKAWAIAPHDASAYFDYGWLRKGLTLGQVQAALDAAAIAYQLERGPAFNTPNLRTATGVLFAFYADQAYVTPADDAAAELSKVYLTQAASTAATSKTNSPDPL